MGTPVLWLCGPPGVGKTTVAWRIFDNLTRAGVPAAYVDIDQLGMCYPEPPDDPNRYRLEAENLRTVVAGYRESGARCVVVSGVLDPEAGISAEELGDGVAITLVRLSAEPSELRSRLIHRLGPSAPVDEAIAEAGIYERSGSGLRIDTGGRSVDEVAALVRDRIGDWPGRPVPPVAGPETEVGDTGGSVLWLCGATGVGKSTVGWEIYLRMLRSGSTAAYVDLEQLGFRRPERGSDPYNERMKARNLAGVWHAFRARGAERLVVVGPIENREIFAAALPDAEMTVIRLEARPETLTERILRRGRGEGWPAPGDPLRGQSDEALLAIAGKATHRAVVGDHQVITDHRPVVEIADEIAALSN